MSASDVASHMATAVDAAAARLQSEAPPLLTQDHPFADKLQLAMGTLYTSSGDTARRSRGPSTSAELCFTLIAFSVKHNKPISALLETNGRIAGDRGVSDTFARVELAKRGIPHSAGPTQSSTYRSGYDAPQAGMRAKHGENVVGNFVDWTNSLDAGERTELFALFAEQFAWHVGTAHKVVAAGSPGKMTYPRFQNVVARLFAEGTEGAVEQYLLAALLEQECERSGLTVRTKQLFAPDSTTSATGDIELVDSNGAVTTAYEVSGSRWQAKIPRR